MSKKVQIKLEELFLNHYNEWCMLSYSYVKNISEAEEVVQDVCVNILLRENESDILNLKAYIGSSIRKRSINRLKQLKKTESLSEANIQLAPSFEEDLIKKEDKQYLINALESLPEPCKKVFILCVVEGQKYKNVAQTMGISVNTVKYHVKNAYKQLRMATLESYFWLLIFAEFLFF
ncbi:RNA polymerase sigma factor [Flavivirga algicola]|uniref:Sigma-70 family RNA polymerase sigma factor n=1 Tax=Flavivirga algicola TaxID=2729136 RepID=A0ABX1RVT3_9FLAO|nr:sigma-70 family RNA polymerase sigma factor [Flavivirga algicola]NMH86878.1 sigma-70 family RNA polymerase sigma factor [Flavivirga algicola]